MTRPEPPPDLPFRGVDAAWAGSVAEGLLWSSRILHDEYLVLDELWVGSEPAIYLRHRRGSHRVGMRIAELDADPFTQRTPSDSGDLSSLLFHTIYDAPRVGAWVDDLGYDWWGDAPPDDAWATAVDGPRLRTLALDQTW